MSTNSPIKSSQTYADELTRQEAARLNCNPQFQVRGLKHWFDYKPFLALQEEESFVDSAWDRLGNLYDHGLMPVPAVATSQ